MWMSVDVDDAAVFVVCFMNIGQRKVWCHYHCLRLWYPIERRIPIIGLRLYINPVEPPGID